MAASRAAASSGGLRRARAVSPVAVGSAAAGCNGAVSGVAGAGVSGAAARAFRAAVSGARSSANAPEGLPPSSVSSVLVSSSAAFGLLSARSLGAMAKV